jgi:hypothetical protein
MRAAPALQPGLSAGRSAFSRRYLTALTVTWLRNCPAPNGEIEMRRVCPQSWWMTIALPWSSPSLPAGHFGHEERGSARHGYMGRAAKLAR